MATIKRIIVSGSHTASGSDGKISAADSLIAIPSNWTATGSWSVSNGNLDYNGGVSGNVALAPASNIESGKNYIIITLINSGQFISYAIGGRVGSTTTETGPVILTVNDTINTNNLAISSISGVSANIKSVQIYELLNVIGNFTWDGSTLTNGEPQYVSDDQFDGNTWYIAYSGSQWIMSDTAGSTTASYFFTADILGVWSDSGTANGTPVAAYINEFNTPYHQNIKRNRSLYHL